MWIEYLNNPFGLRVGDCVIRAISKALNQSWEKTYIDLCVQGFMMEDADPKQRETLKKWMRELERE